MRKKVVSPALRRAFANEVVGQELCSQRQACRFLKLARSTFNYLGRPPTPAEEQLRKRLLELSAEHPRYGYRRIAALLRREGWRVGRRQIQRLRRAEGLRVPPTKRKIVRRGILTGLPHHGDASEPRLDVGFHCGCDGAWWRIEAADDPG
jgi:putative transposase